MVDKRAPVVFFTNKRGMNLRRTLLEAGAREVTDSEAVLEGVLKTMWGERFGVKEQVAEGEPQEDPINGKRIKVYVSYSEKDDDYALAFKKYVSSLSETLPWDVRADNNIKSGETYSRSMQLALLNSDIALSFISANYLNSSINMSDLSVIDPIWGGKDPIIKLFPVILEECNWQKHAILFIRSKVIQPFGKPVSEHSNQDEAWAEVVRIIQNALANDSNKNPESTVAPDPEILNYQQKLQQLGFYKSEPNGISDAQNKAAIQDFQKAFNLPADGAMGPQTLRTLDAVVAASQTPEQTQSQSAPAGPNEHLRNMVREGRVEQALEEMLDLWPDENELILFAAKFHGDQGQPTSKS
ncbi:MAG: peptidoglycan-binding protein [Saprospiraceae bacterium]|nr:peptidoglycan-binding protein [Saprospiraceae bacterium]